jgi:hypothetical protein
VSRIRKLFPCKPVQFHGSRGIGDCDEGLGRLKMNHFLGPVRCSAARWFASSGDSATCSAPDASEGGVLINTDPFDAEDFYDRTGIVHLNVSRKLYQSTRLWITHLQSYKKNCGSDEGHLSRDSDTSSVGIDPSSLRS